MAARQNLKKRARRVALRSKYNPLRASYGLEWERLCLRMGHLPFRNFSIEEMRPKLISNSVYGKFANK